MEFGFENCVGTLFYHVTLMVILSTIPMIDVLIKTFAANMI